MRAAWNRMRAVRATGAGADPPFPRSGPTRVATRYGDPLSRA